MFSKDFFKKNRRGLGEKIKDSSIVVFFSKDPVIKGDSEYFNFADNNMFYFTGLEQSKVRFFIFKDEKGKVFEYLFVKKTSEIEDKFDGKKLDFSQISDVSGISKKNIFYLDEFDEKFNAVLDKICCIYFFNEEKYIEGMSLSEIYEAKIKKEKTDVEVLNSFDIVKDMRIVKSSQEVLALKRACLISSNAYSKLLSQIKNFKNEKEIEAFFSYEFCINFSSHSYHPIVASGKNSCILHYVENNKDLDSTGLVLLDVGAEFKNYKSDISRTFPILGKFSDRQREVYEKVLEVQKFAISILKAGILKRDFEIKTRKFMCEKLVELGLLNSDECEKDFENKFKYSMKYYPHAIGHFLGLDTHDIGGKSEVFKSGMVFTIEPGIYIDEEEIGIRIEDNVLVGEDGCEVLSDSIVKEVDEIEKLIGNP